MKDWQSQAHVRWDCKYHVVILPKSRREVLYGRMRRGVGQVLRDLCRRRRSWPNAGLHCLCRLSITPQAA
jgi:REP element-mobilizing transposase RayT